MDEPIPVTAACFPEELAHGVISRDLPLGYHTLGPGQTIRIETGGRPLRLRNVGSGPIRFEVIGS